MKIPPVPLTPTEREAAYMVWQELKCAEGEPAKERARQKLQSAPWTVQQAIMREAASQIMSQERGSRGRNPFSTRP